jgi:hypothetical protein
MHIVAGFKRSLIIALIVLLAASTANALPLQGEATVHTVGGSRVRGGDLSAARQEAINAGLAAAVHRVLADLLPPETVSGNFQALNEALLSQTDPFVRNYKVLAHSTLATHYRTVIEATISVDRIKEALRTAGIHLVQRQYPSVLFCVAESHIDDPVPRYWWSGRSAASDAIADANLSLAFEKAGFVVIEPIAGAEFGGYPPELRATEAVSIGRQLQAEVVVVGLARTEASANIGAGSGASSYRGSITARALRVSDGLQIAQTQRTVPAADAEQTDQAAARALRDAIDRAAQDLTAQIDSFWFEKAAAGKRIEMAVHGISGNMANFVRFRGALSNLSGVDRLQLKERTSDAAVLNLEFQGNTRTLADALLRLGFEGFRVTIGQLEADTIQVQLVHQ